ncbi:2-octaprenyl-6-methoxyphenyl hydroxylase [Vibrio europaeus]|uniref:2-octaprenyl-6-methoxyphenyl hydroxylase n=1 Tax=Vibrio europaeus TaxID=300876 RepID=A0A178JIN8_9VIBR|nr:2-octaprenyl-6-methoxyphenyl hydroxylase [Vibrio europaeus]MDC5704530.1 2-octaprenyl-6-methoxyphenyl hydroxylase [Vibrio europaeus]MDC5709160.1 2-octaprenyl-6-methoxyphenyl hydroxylase [Vibrio europaeus]MDC5717500.1 2-octaprenyl-6-methoxyphenyl hydroxylase [Vibrio europaeus]MDC5718569.1 2-octaprenyl-6-methoxyphenyl hydroxylase [Vibrio europaeus]MDC5727999.1 2-octaprenyl-6-methoxyphenyl hydroxylase [Vibrio europaeus]
MKQFDVVIAGGAMAGMTLALAINKLTLRPLSVAVIEPFQVDHGAHPGFDSRSIALSYGTVAILKQLGLWQEIAKVATPIEHIHVSDRSHAGMTDITTEEVGVDALGYVVELADVGRIYHQQVEQDNNISVLHAAVEQVERSEEKVSITLSDGNLVEGKLLVAADGAISTCCEQTGIELCEHDFEQIAVIANISAQSPHNGRAFERFTESGPVALLPMSQGRMSLVWCVRPDKAQQIINYNDEQFLSELQQAFGWRLGKLQKVGHRASYPLLLRYREQNVSHRFAIVGNAAQTLHPIAGQGFNLGIRDVATLAESIAKSSDDPGSYCTLKQFKNARRDDRNATIAMTSALVHIFSNDYLSLRVGRNLGLFGMDNLPVLKAPLLRRTLGLVSR